MRPPRPVVAVIYAEVTAPVVRAQTPPLLDALRSAGRRVDAAVFTSPRALIPGTARAQHVRAISAIAGATGVEPIRRTHLPRDRGFGSLGRALARALAKRGLDGAVLLCRQPRAALIGAAARDAIVARRRARPSVVLDLRGLRDVEYLMTLGRKEDALTPPEREQLQNYRVQEELACRQADAVLCVSRPMQRHVATRYGLDDAKLGHVPNHAEPVRDAEPRRFAARAELGIDAGAVLVAYSGTLAAWQMPDASIRLFQGLRAARHDARLLFLTPDTGAAEEALRRATVEDAIVRSAPPGETARLLCAADYGLLLRQDDVVNLVACPVKFGEYLACGVRPILTPHIGDQSDLCQTSDLGVVVGLAHPADAGRLLGADAARSGTIDATGRERRRTWAREHISPERAAARVAEFLERSVGG